MLLTPSLPRSLLSSDVPSRLAHLGFSDAEALRKRVLFDLVLETFKSVAGGAPEHALWVPGRLEIFGKHTDYGGGHTLVAPVPRGFIAAARPRSDAVVALHDASRREQFVVDRRISDPPSRFRATAGKPADPRTGDLADSRTSGPAVQPTRGDGAATR